MCKSIFSILGFVSTILAFIYLIKVYGDTKIDIFQENIIPGEKDNYFIDPALNPDQTLKYDQYCKVYQEIIMSPNTKKLGDVFTLNTESIHNQSFYLIFINLYILLFYVFLFVAFILFIIAPPRAGCIAIVLVILTLILFVIMIIANILFFILIYNYYNGDTSIYNSFLQCRNVNYEGFRRYRIVEVFRKDFIYFMTYNIISIISSFFANRKSDTNE